VSAARIGGALFALAALAACATSTPRASDAYADLLIARVASARADYDVATDRYLSAMRRAPDDRTAVEGALSAALAAGDAARAEAIGRRIDWEDAPGGAHLVRAAVAIRESNWSRARAELDGVEAAAGDQLVARMLSVWVDIAQGRVDDVLMDLGPLAQVQPYGSLFAYQQGLALDLGGRQEAALAAFDVAARGGMQLPLATQRQADLLARRGDLDAARALLAGDGSEQHAALVAARARLDAGQPVAPTPLTAARAASISIHGLAMIFQREGDPATGASTLTLVLVLDPQSDAARVSFAQALSVSDRADAALAFLDQVPDGSDFASLARRLEAWVLFDSERKDEALELARALAQSGDLRDQKNLADLYRAAGQFDEAEPLYASLAAESPSDWRLRFALGAARERLGRWDEAEADFQRALTLSPEQPEVLNYLAYGWVERGERLTEAMAMLERALAQRPNSAAIIDSVGWAHFRAGDYGRALDYMEQAVALAPADAVLNDHLGDVYWRLSRRLEARFQWRRALMLEPENARAIEAKIANGLPEQADRRLARE
jgi:tetratricopeptide (TPR) repeat protein